MRNEWLAKAGWGWMGLERPRKRRRSRVREHAPPQGRAALASTRLSRRVGKALIADFGGGTAKTLPGKVFCKVFSVTHRNPCGGTSLSGTPSLIQVIVATAIPLALSIFKLSEGANEDVIEH